MKIRLPKSYKSKRTRKYRSYKGEITPAPENIIARDFHATKPNEKWLSDITEFAIPAVSKLKDDEHPKESLGFLSSRDFRQKLRFVA